jgi:hypothetical protein
LGSTTLSNPVGIHVDASGSLYVADQGHNRVVKIVYPFAGTVVTIAGQYGSTGSAGDGGPATSAYLRYPEDVLVDATGNIYIADNDNNRVHLVTKSTGIISTLAGDGAYQSSGDGGPATSASICHPDGMAIDSVRGILYVTQDGDVAGCAKVRAVSLSTGIITTAAGTGTAGYSGDGGPATLAMIDGNWSPQVAVDSNGNLFIAAANNNAIRYVQYSSGIIYTIAGGSFGSAGDGGPATSALLHGPYGVALDEANGRFFVVDTDNNVIRSVAFDFQAPSLDDEGGDPSFLNIDFGQKLVKIKR